MGRCFPLVLVQGPSSSGGLPSPQDQARLPERTQNTLECPVASAPCAWARFFWDLRISLNKTKRLATQKRAKDTKEPAVNFSSCFPDTLHAEWEERKSSSASFFPGNGQGARGKGAAPTGSRSYMPVQQAVARGSVPGLVGSVWCPLMVLLTLPLTPALPSPLENPPSSPCPRPPSAPATLRTKWTHSRGYQV